MKITFYGATEGVTGSNYLVETGGTKFLVDCGLFQGGEEQERKNWEKFPYNPAEINFVVATHSHIDHIGRLPYLYKSGFKGKIYATAAASDFSRIFLEDTCKLLGDTAKDLKVEPLFTQNDVMNTTSLFEACDYYQTFRPAEDIEITLFDAGHILGSAIVQIKAEGKTIVFSGDLGNPPVPILRNTDIIPQADYVVMESTYGDRNHERWEKRRERLERIIEDATKNKGVVLMPSFAMERTQEILYELNQLIENNRIPKVPVFIDSPLAIKATEIYKNYPEYFDEEAKALLARGDNFFDFPGLKFIENIEESKALDRNNGSKIIIAGSGMSNGGRIVYHEQFFLPQENTILLIVGYQVKGTPGRALYDGAKRVRLMGEEVEVKARVEAIESYSAHADQERLKFWVSKIKAVKQVMLVHGEEKAKETLRPLIEAELAIKTTIPRYGEIIEI